MKDLRIRTKEFALRVIRLYSSLPTSTEAQVIGKQLLRSGTSVVHIIAKAFVPVQMQNLSANLKVVCKSWKKAATGWSY